MADIGHLCLGCMEDKGLESTCPNCGWQVGTSAEAPQHLPPGMILHEKYLIGRVLGHGGFGITYLAWDLNLDMKLAIKEYMPRDFATRTPGKTMVSVFTGDLNTHFEHGLAKFLDEAKTLAQFSNHPGIVGVRDFFKENGTAYLVMYYLEGIDFKQYLESQGGKIPYETALMIMLPVMDALREVHRTGTLHRDISPDNIYITAEGQVKILDFGAARHAVSEFSKSISVILKPGFAPEEQYRSKGKQGPWTDIYATAATLYRALVGHVPPESLDRLEEDTIVPPSSLGVNIPQKAEAALMKALSVKALERFQSMEEFQNELLVEMEVNTVNKMNPNAIHFSLNEDSNTSNKASENKKLENTKTKSSTKWFWIGGGIAALIILAIGITGVLFIFNSLSASDERKEVDNGKTEENNIHAIKSITKTVTVPNLVNSLEKDAITLLQNKGLELGNINYVESLFVNKGYVMDQSLKPDSTVNEKDRINLEISKGVDLPFDTATIKSKGLPLVYEYWDKGYELGVKEDYEPSLKYYLQARGMALIVYAENGDYDSQYALGVLDYNISLNKINLGYYELALPNVLSSVNYLEKLPSDQNVLEHQEELADSYGHLAYVQFLNNMPKEAAESIEKALELAPDDIVFQATLAHAYLFLDDFDYAMDIYGELKDEKVNENQTFEQFVLEDFKYFREIGLTHPGMDKVEKTYAEMAIADNKDLKDELMITIYANAIAFENEDLEGYKLTLDPAVANTVDKDMIDLFQAVDNIKVEFENIDVNEMLESTAKVRVVQILTYSEGANNYESKSTLVHHFIRSDGLYKWLITRTDVEG